MSITESDLYAMGMESEAAASRMPELCERLGFSYPPEHHPDTAMNNQDVTQAPNIGSVHKRITAVGSRVTCTPPPMDTDQDWLVLVDDKDFDLFAKELVSSGWVVGGSLIPNDANYLPPNQRFNSFTLGVDNVIATASKEFHDRFLSASATAKNLNLLKKEDRITLFQSVLYATVCDPIFLPDRAPVTDPLTESQS